MREDYEDIMPIRAVADKEDGVQNSETAERFDAPALRVLSTEAIKRKYKQVWAIEVTVDGDDEQEGRILKFIFRRPSTGSFNRYMKTASKNMTASTVVFVEDNVIDEQRNELKKECEDYPGLALNLGQKLLGIIGLGTDINFKQL